MEIRQYLHRAGRRAWLLVLVPLLALLVVVPWALQQPDRYEGAVTVTVQAADPEASPALVRQQLESFISLSRTRAVLDPVAGEAQVSLDELSDRLDVEEIGASNLVEIAYRSTSPEDAVAVPRAVAARTLEALRGSELDVAVQDVEGFRANYEQAVADLRDFVAASGPVLPEDAYQDALDEGDDVDEAELTTARDQFLEYRLLQAAVSRARDQLATAQAREVQLQARADWDAAEGEAVLASEPQPVDETPFVLQAVAGAVVGGVLLAAALLLLGELLSRRRGQGRPVGARNAGGAVADADADPGRRASAPQDTPSGASVRAGSTPSERSSLGRPAGEEEEWAQTSPGHQPTQSRQ